MSSGVGSPGNVPVFHGSNSKVVDKRMRVVEVVLRCVVCGLGVLAAALVGFDKQEKVFFSVHKEAKFTDMKALVFLVIANVIAASYSFFQGLRCIVSMIRGTVLFNKTLAWAIFSFDQKAYNLTILGCARMLCSCRFASLHCVFGITAIFQSLLTSANRLNYALDAFWLQEKVTHNIIISGRGLAPLLLLLFRVCPYEITRDMNKPPNHNFSHIDRNYHCVFSWIMAYVMLAALAAAAESAVLGQFGQPQLQWMKVCNMYGKFCNQVGEGIVSSLVVSLSMVTISGMSAFNLFRLYGSNRGKGSGKS